MPLNFTDATTEGLAIGIFNALTNKTEAWIKNAENDVRKIQTEPLTQLHLVGHRESV